MAAHQILTWTMSRFTATLLVVLVALAMCMSSTEAQGLAFGFYGDSCLDAEATIYKILNEEAQKVPLIRADLLRVHFHDCMVRGADASVLIDGTGTERQAPPNFRLEGFKVIDKIKEKLEKLCPETVSCADILAFAARDGVAQAGGPNWAVRGGLVSKGSEAVAILPGADMNVKELAATSAKQGLTQEEMVTLSGAHTIGDAACVHIDSRIQGSTPDPLLPKDYLDELKGKCPQPGQRVMPTVEFDRITGTKFDTNYYSNVQERKGLLTSDQALYEDQSTRPTVLKYSTNQDAFFQNFKAAMLKLSEIGVLTGTQGEIRLNCNAINSANVDQKGQKQKQKGKGKGGKGKE